MNGKEQIVQNCQGAPLYIHTLSDTERRAMGQIAYLQGMVVSVSGDKYVALREQVREGKKAPQKLIEVQREDLQNVISYMRKAIKAGLNKDLTLELYPAENKHYIRLIFDEEYDRTRK